MEELDTKRKMQYGTLKLVKYNFGEFNSNEVIIIIHKHFPYTIIASLSIH